jgi:ribosome-interacting GTPase 1
MPANLPPQYYELEREFKRESDPKEKLRLAQELLAMMPKHKGTDKLQAEMKAKISKLKLQIEGGQKKHGTHHQEVPDHIDREGAAQIILIGPPNSGKSSLLASLTHAHPLIADYPYATREPLAGMMTFETVQFQLIDTPPISSESFESFLVNLIHNADIVLLVADLASPDMLADLSVIRNLLSEKRIQLVSKIPEEVADPRLTFKRTIISAHKIYEDGAEKSLDELKNNYSNFEIVPTSILDDNSLNNLKRAVFSSLRIIRVYTKRIGHEPALIDPIILPIGGTVENAAMTIHKDFANQLQFAKVWGKGKIDGQKVKSNFVLSDEDIIEFHI